MLTLTEKAELHAALEARGIRTFTHILVRRSAWKYFFSHARYLGKFCKEHKIDMVLSHLQEGNIIGVLARPFLKSKLIAFRHHAESAFQAEFGKKFGIKRSKREVLLDRIINRFARQIVVPSSDVWKSMEKYEGCNMKKVQLIPYIYDFSAYPRPDETAVEALSKTLDCKLLLGMVSRMILSKQHLPVFRVIKKLIDEGLSVKMLVMDDGPLRPQLEKFIVDNNMAAHIILTGFRKDFINYMAAVDLLIHPSLTEASNNVVKEMGLLEKGVAVCRDVGDFNEYIKEGQNGYFLDRNDLENSVEKVIRDAYSAPDKLKTMGAELGKSVFDFFSDSPANRQRYLDLLN